MRFKYQEDKDNWPKVSPKLQEITLNMAHWCDDRQLDFVITDALTTAAQDRREHRNSVTHREGRAVDISIKGWSDRDIKAFIETFTLLYGSIGAVSLGTNKPTLIVFGDSAHKDHMHVQLNRSFAVV